MRFSGLVIICVLILLHEASCVSFQRELYNAVIKKADDVNRERFKRQTDEQEMCIENELDETVGKDSACKLAALDELDEGVPTDEQQQTFINTVRAVVCERDCGRAVIDAYELAESLKITLDLKSLL